VKKYKIGQKVVYNRDVYSIVDFDGSNDSLIVKRVGQSTPITIPSDQAHPIMEEGKDDDINRVSKLLKG